MSRSHHKKRKKGPGLFSDIGKKAKDLLTKDYSYNQKFSITTNSETGVALTSSVVENRGLSAGTVAARYKHNNTVLDVEVYNYSKISAILTFRDIFPSTNIITSFRLPNYKYSQLEVQYFHEHAAFTMSVDLNQSPEVKLSATIGTPGIAFGVEAKYKTASSLFTKYNAGISMMDRNSNASILLAEKGDLLRASYVHYLYSKRIAIAAGITQRFSTSESTFAVGGSCAVDHRTMVKVSFNNHRKLRTFIQHRIKTKSYLKICGEFDTKALDKIPRIGLALAFNI